MRPLGQKRSRTPNNGSLIVSSKRIAVIWPASTLVCIPISETKEPRDS